MVFLSFLDTNIAFFALGAYNLKFSGYALVYGKKVTEKKVAGKKSKTFIKDQEKFKMHKNCT